MSQKIVTNLLRYAVKSGADRLDINIQPKKITLTSRLAHGGDWKIDIPKKLEKDFISSLRRLVNLAPNELIDRKYSKIINNNWHLNFRLSIKPWEKGERIIMDFINHPLQLWRLNQLGLSATYLKKIRAFLRRRSGLMVISSPPGQGRSSTLSALLIEINNPNQHICWLSSLDKLPSFSVPGVSYLTGAQAKWENLYKHDADLIIADDISEIKDISQAIALANKGKLIIISLVSNSLKETLNLIKKSAQEAKQPLEALKIASYQELTAWPKQSTRNPRQRKLLGRFKIWTA